ncbi:MAG TPA: histidine phosphatase family protein [Saprospiraceae bacterium]|nr:histidine phosphatase family protein [Saprospiraceae bacterium]
MEKQIYIIRHGETEMNRLRIVQGSGVDSSLNSLGKEQSLAFYNHYKNIKFDIAVCSGLVRTLETIYPFVLDGLPYIMKDEFNEISWGEHEGREPDEDTLKNYHSIIQSWKTGIFEHTVPGGESPTALRERLLRGLEFIKTLPHQKILLCTHGRALRCLLTILKDESMTEMENYGHKNTCLYLVRLKDEKYIINLENNTEHLTHTHLINKDW